MRTTWFVPAVLAILACAGCSKRREAPTAPPPPAAPRTITVRMTAPNVFVPKDTTVAHGDTVLWINDGPAQHTTTSGPCPPCGGDGLWNSGNMTVGTTYRVVFGPGTNQQGLVHVDSTGFFPYFCIPHAPGMSGSITVTP